MAWQKTLSIVGWSTQFSTSSCDVGVLTASFKRMWYQSNATLKPGMNLGRSTTPAVHVLAVSAFRFGLPPVVPWILAFWGEKSSSAGSKVVGLMPSPFRIVAQFAWRNWVPL